VEGTHPCQTTRHSPCHPSLASARKLCMGITLRIIGVNQRLSLQVDETHVTSPYRTGRWRPWSWEG